MKSSNNPEDYDYVIPSAYTRKKFEIDITQIFQDPKFRNNELCLIFIDVDDLKPINKKYGYFKGDSILQQISNKINETIIKHINGCSIYRFAGDEFIVLLPNTSLSNSINFAEKLRVSIQNTNFDLNENETIKKTISAGVVNLNNKMKDIQTFILMASNAMYQAKKEGKNRIVISNIN